VSALGIITGLGWVVINSTVGAQVLRVVFDDKLPMAIGMIIIAMFLMIISFVGYKWIHTYERYSWIPVFIRFCILAGIDVKHFTHSRTVIFL
jgi:purine-cytosine permease-like protein